MKERTAAVMAASEAREAANKAWAALAALPHPAAQEIAWAAERIAQAAEQAQASAA